MASLTQRTTKKGIVFDIQFYDVNHVKRTLWGFTSKRGAERTADKIEKLVRAKKKGVEIPDEVQDWLETLPNDLYGKIQKWELAPLRVLPGTLKELVEMFTTDKSAKTQTLRNRQTAAKHLFEFFGENVPVTSISTVQAVKFDLAMRERLAKCTWGREVKTVKQFFKRAVDLEWIKENPFRNLKGSSAANTARQYFITLEEAQKILDACPNSEMRLIFTLGRFGGLRIPSELQFMEWSDIDIEGDVFIVKEPKKTNKDKQEAGELETRAVPMYPELKKAFQEYWEDLPEGGSGKVFPDCKTGQALTSRFRKILNRAGVPMWPKFFQNMRSTCETELNNNYPIADVTRWMGNTPAVAQKHYLQASKQNIVKATQTGRLQEKKTPSPKNRCNSETQEPVKSGEEPVNYELIALKNSGIISGMLREKTGINSGLQGNELIVVNNGLNPQNRALTQEKEKSLHLLQAQIILWGCDLAPYFTGSDGALGLKWGLNVCFNSVRFSKHPFSVWPRWG